MEISYGKINQITILKPTNITFTKKLIYLSVNQLYCFHQLYSLQQDKHDPKFSKDKVISSIGIS